MKRLLSLKAKLKVKQAESVVRVRNYGMAARNLTKVIEEIKEIKEKIKHESDKVKKPI
jgi:NAD/NADP transhydrogenase beta subunit